MTTSTRATAPAEASDWKRLFSPVHLALTVAFLVAVALNGLELGTALGLPAHPLLVHVPVVLGPLLAIAVIAFAVRPELIDRYGIVAGVLGLVTLATAALAVGAGEALEDGVRAEDNSRLAHQLLEDHAEKGEMFRTILVLFVFVLLASVILRRTGATQGLLSIFESGAGEIAKRVIWVLVGVGVLYGAYAAGHSGAKASWHDVKVTSENSGGGEHDEGARLAP